MVHNPVWLQVILYLAIAAFPCLSGYMFYSAYEAIHNSGLGGAVVFIFLGVGVAYISYIGFLLAKFVSARVEFDEQQFTVSIKDDKTAYKWSDIASVRNYESSQVLRLFDSSGKTIYVVDHLTPGYQLFADKVCEVANF